MAATQTEEMNRIVRRFIGEAGNMTQAIGLGRIVGQIYAYVYFSAEPRSLSDMENALGVSKGSASMGIRQLEQWHAVSKVWIKGDRKDYYEANDWLGRIVKNAILDTIGKKMESFTTLIEELDEDSALLENGDPDDAFVKERVEHLRTFQQRAQKLWSNPVVQKLLQ